MVSANTARPTSAREHLQTSSLSDSSVNPAPVDTRVYAMPAPACRQPSASMSVACAVSSSRTLDVFCGGTTVLDAWGPRCIAQLHSPIGVQRGLPVEFDAYRVPSELPLISVQENVALTLHCSMNGIGVTNADRPLAAIEGSLRGPVAGQKSCA